MHADFLSIPSARYTGKAGEAPTARCLAPWGRFTEMSLLKINASTTQRSGIR
ncbi:hypothetical protein APV28_2045 [Comamonas testosteroni]|nr:hypothetical protein APV28_2045 [Comamonas testosteroni]